MVGKAQPYIISPVGMFLNVIDMDPSAAATGAVSKMLLDHPEQELLEQVATVFPTESVICGDLASDRNTAATQGKNNNSTRICNKIQQN